MTTPEHTLVGLHAALACDCHRRWGWTAVATAALASNIPDWDGLPVLIDINLFDAGHRTWGHNFLAILLSACVLAWTQHRFHWMEKIARRIQPWLPGEMTADHADEQRSPSMWVLIAIAVAVQLIHLPCDMVVSGGHGLSDWHIKPFWPFANARYVYPLIPWGDVSPTVILMAGLIACVKWRERAGTMSRLALLALVAYLFVARNVLYA